MARPLTVVVNIFLCGCLVGAGPSSKTVFEKALIDGRRLVVVQTQVRRDVAYPELRPDSLERPPANVEYPDRVFEYSFVVVSADGKDRRELGWKRNGVFDNPVRDPRFIVYDVVVFDETMVAVYQAGRGTCADVIGPAADGRRRGMAVRDTALIADVDWRFTKAVGGRINGSLADGTLEVTVDQEVDHVSHKVRFRLAKEAGEFRWVRQPPSTQPATEPRAATTRPATRERGR